MEKNAKREHNKALNILTAYALVPCTNEDQGVRLTCTNVVGGLVTVFSLSLAFFILTMIIDVNLSLFVLTAHVRSERRCPQYGVLKPWTT